MEELPLLTITSATEQAELRSVLLYMANGKNLTEACAEVRISTNTAKRRMATYPEVLSDFKKANEAIMRSQLLSIVEARDKATTKLTEILTGSEDADTLMRISNHLLNESDRIQSALNTEGSSRDDEVKKIMGIHRRPISSRMEITINLQGESTKSDDTLPPIVIDAISE